MLRAKINLFMDFLKTVHYKMLNNVDL